jgi:hypothetical protein
MAVFHQKFPLGMAPELWGLFSRACRRPLVAGTANCWIAGDSCRVSHRQIDNLHSRRHRQCRATVRAAHTTGNRVNAPYDHLYTAAAVVLLRLLSESYSNCGSAPNVAQIRRNISPKSGCRFATRSRDSLAKPGRASSTPGIVNPELRSERVVFSSARCYFW